MILTHDIFVKSGADLLGRQGGFTNLRQPYRGAAARIPMQDVPAEIHTLIANVDAIRARNQALDFIFGAAAEGEMPRSIIRFGHAWLGCYLFLCFSVFRFVFFCGL